MNAMHDYLIKSAYLTLPYLTLSVEPIIHRKNQICACLKQGYVIRWISNSVNYSKKYDDMCEAYCFEINRPQG